MSVLDAATLVRALEDIALLDEADGHDLTSDHAATAVAIATNVLGKHPSVIFAERAAVAGSRLRVSRENNLP